MALVADAADNAHQRRRSDRLRADAGPTSSSSSPDSELPVVVKGILTADRRAAGRRARSRWRGRLQPRRPPARHGALRRRRAAGGRRRGRRRDRRASSTAASDAAPTCSRRSRSEPAAALVGRPVLWGLAVNGAAGAQRVLEILLEEFEAALKLAGAPRADDARSQLRHPGAVGAAGDAVKILVTGVTGYVGAAVAPALLRDGHEVTRLRPRPRPGEAHSPDDPGRRRHRRTVWSGRSPASRSPTT